MGSVAEVLSCFELYGHLHWLGMFWGTNKTEITLVGGRIEPLRGNSSLDDIRSPGIFGFHERRSTLVRNVGPVSEGLMIYGSHRALLLYG